MSFDYFHLFYMARPALKPLPKSSQWNWLQTGLWLAPHTDGSHVAIREQLQHCSQMTSSSLCLLCALEILTFVFILPALPATLSNPLQLHTHTICAHLNLAAPLPDTLFDLSIYFQLFSSLKALGFVKIFSAHLYLILVPSYLIYVKYHFCLFL